MKTVCKTLVLLLLVLSLVLTLLSCTSKKENETDDDGWMKEDVSTDTDKYAHAQQRFDDSDSDGAYQSSERVTLPLVPLD